MFLTFLNKHKVSFVDSSLLTTYSPYKVLSYFYDRRLNIGLDIHEALSRMDPEFETVSAPLKEWLDFIGVELEGFAEMQLLRENEYLTTIGPYYYTPTNTRIYFTKTKPSADQVFTAEDMEILDQMHNILPLDPTLYAQLKVKKGSKKSTKGKEDLLQEIKICLAAFRESERLSKQLNFLSKFLETRTAVLRNKEIHLIEPDNIPEKPQIPVTAPQPSKLSFLNRKNRNKKKPDDTKDRYNHDIKIYYIRYREYEKACDRYKQALENWPAARLAFINACQKEVERIKESINYIQHQLKSCNSVLQNSAIHQKYQDQQVLAYFKDYLETGRATDIQSCMNIYEEESLWHELKAGQERIENTIYFLQSENEHVHLAQQHMQKLFKEKNFKELPKV